MSSVSHVTVWELNSVSSGSKLTVSKFPRVGCFPPRNKYEQLTQTDEGALVVRLQMNGLCSRVPSRSFAPAGDAVFSAAKNINLYFTQISSRVQTGTFLSHVLVPKIFHMNVGWNAEELHVIIKHGRVVTTEHVESRNTNTANVEH